jgi:hypothetical protein
VTSGTSKAGSQWDVTFDQLLFLQILYLSLEMEKKSFINTWYPTQYIQKETHILDLLSSGLRNEKILFMNY